MTSFYGSSVYCFCFCFWSVRMVNKIWIDDNFLFRNKSYIPRYDRITALWDTSEQVQFPTIPLRLTSLTEKNLVTQNHISCLMKHLNGTFHFKSISLLCAYMFFFINNINMYVYQVVWFILNHHNNLPSSTHDY